MTKITQIKEKILFLLVLGSFFILPYPQEINFFVTISVFYFIPGVFFVGYLFDKEIDIFQFIAFSIGFGIVFHVLLNLPIFIFGASTNFIHILTIVSLFLMVVATDFSKIYIEKASKEYWIILLFVLIISILFFRIGAIQTGEDTIYFTMIRKLTILDYIQPWDMSYYSDENHNVKIAIGIAPWFSSFATYSVISGLEPYFVLKKVIWILFIFGVFTFYSLSLALIKIRKVALLSIFVYLAGPVFKFITEYEPGISWVTESIRPQLFNSYYLMGFALLCFLTFWNDCSYKLRNIILLSSVILVITLLNISHIVPISLMLSFYIFIKLFFVEGVKKKMIMVIVFLSIFLIPTAHVINMQKSISGWQYGVGILFLTMVQDMRYFDTAKFTDGHTIDEVLDEKSIYNLKNFTRLNYVNRDRMVYIGEDLYFNMKRISPLNVSLSLMILMLLPFSKNIFASPIKGKVTKYIHSPPKLSYETATSRSNDNIYFFSDG